MTRWYQDCRPPLSYQQHSLVSALWILSQSRIRSRHVLTENNCTVCLGPFVHYSASFGFTYLRGDDIGAPDTPRRVVRPDLCQTHGHEGQARPSEDVLLHRAAGAASFPRCTGAHRGAALLLNSFPAPSIALMAYRCLGTRSSVRIHLSAASEFEKIV